MRTLVSAVAGSVLLGIGMLVSAQALAGDGSSPSSIVPQCSDNPRVIWKRQLGGPGREYASDVATDPNGNILLSGPASDGYWVAKLTPSGDPLWWRQPGGTIGVDEEGNILAASGSDGGILVLAKYNIVGDLLWTKEHILEGLFPTKVVFDLSGNAVIGLTSRVFCVHGYCSPTSAAVVKVNFSGEIVWLSSRLGGTGSNYIAGIATVGDDILVGGTTSHNALSSMVPWIIKFGPGGEVLWWRILDDIGDRSASGMTVDPAGNIISGGSRITDSQGQWTVSGWIGKYGPTGDLLWTRRMADQPRGVATDAAGNIVIHGNMPGRMGTDPGDVWVQKRDPDGNILWKVRLRTGKEDTSAGVAVDLEGNVVVGGTTYGSLGGPSGGDADAWVAKLRP